MQLTENMREFLGRMTRFLVAEIKNIGIERFGAPAAREPGESSDAILKRRPDARFREQCLGKPVAAGSRVEDSQLVLVQVKLYANVFDFGFHGIRGEVFEDGAGQAAERPRCLRIVGHWWETAKVPLPSHRSV